MKKRIILGLIILLTSFIVFYIYNNQEQTSIPNSSIPEKCIIKTFGEFEVYDLRIYDEPIFIEENSHKLNNNQFIPEWYIGYSAVLAPGNFENIHLRNEALHSSRIEEDGMALLDSLYYQYKNVEAGRPLLRSVGYGKVCTRTLKVRNIKTKKEYLIIPLNFYSIKEGFLKNSEYNLLTTTLTFSFGYDKTMYKSTAGKTLIELIDSSPHYSEILSYMNLGEMIKLNEDQCYQVVNTNNKANFDPKKLPQWLFDKVNSK